MRVLGLGFLLSCFWTVAYAQSIPVRSGEHPTFTRLVFTLPERVQFELIEDSRRAVLNFNLPNWTPDFTEVFSRIPRSRLEDVRYSPQSNETILSFNCECEVNTFWFGDSFFVLDISDRDTVTESTTPVASSKKPDRVGTYSQTVRVTEYPNLQGEKTNSPSATILGESLSQASSANSDEVQNGINIRYGDRVSLEELVTQIRSQTENALAERAPYQGSQTQPETLLGEQVLESSDLSGQNALNSSSQFLIRRGDFPREVKDRVASKDESDAACIDNHEFEVALLRPQPEFASAVGKMRAAIFNERDIVNNAEMYKLALLYLHQGFGAEARAALQLISDPTYDLRLINALADVMDDGHSTNRLLGQQIGCNGAASFWGLFYGENLSPPEQINGEAILRTFAELPRHLRLHLGPIASRRFLEAGLADISDSISRMTRATVPSGMTNTDLLDQELDRYFGTGPSPADMGSGPLEQSDMASAEDVIQRIEYAVSKNQEVSPDLAELAGAFAFEYSDQNQGIDIFRAYVVALGASGQFGEAYKELNQQTNSGNDDDVSVRSRLASLLAVRANDMEILKRFFSNDIGPVEYLEEDAAIVIAEVLLANGFVEELEMILNRSFSSSTNRRARLLRAKAALERGSVQEVEVQLLGLTGSDVDELNGQLKEQKDSRPSTLQIFRDEASQEQPPKTQTAENESRLLTSSERLDQPVEDALLDASLEQATNLLSNAGNTRDRIVDILRSNPMPDNELQ